MQQPREILTRYGLEPKQSLGQNFLWDENILNRLLAAAGLTATDQVLEIGPGLGHLTELLASTAERVVALELDDRFIPILQDRLQSYQNVRIVHGDVLEQDLGELLGTGRYKV
ncbi:MAG: methyltransferase domain-containing protein, partial [Anaerolineales bacterium]|nr:methyltransferase domain-containing protein [Anaerolineales bacterium]